MNCLVKTIEENCQNTLIYDTPDDEARPVIPSLASSATALALPRLPRASPTAPHRPMGQDGRLSADGKRIRPREKPSSLHTPHPNDTNDPRSNISSWPGPNLNGAQSNGFSLTSPLPHHPCNTLSSADQSSNLPPNQRARP